MKKKMFLALVAVMVAVAVVTAACAGGMHPATVPPPPRPAAVHLYVRSAADQSLWVVDVSNGQIARTLPAGTPSPDWLRLYRVSAGALDVLDPLTGEVAATHPAPAWAQLTRTSAAGRYLVFMRDGPSDRFQLQDADWAARPVDVALHGAFTFDGISDDGRRLYLLEQLGGGQYHVRMFDTVEGALAPYVIVDKTNLEQVMSGTALASFTTASGAMQLTLYQRPTGGGSAFIHELPIGQAMPIAFCLDLPGPPDGWAFTAAPDGRRFYAVNAGAGQVVELVEQGDGPAAVRQGQIPTRPGEAALTVSPDGRTLYVGTPAGVTAVDTRTLAVRATGLRGQPVTAVAASPDGAGVYAVTYGSRLVRLDPRTLAAAGTVTVAGPMGPILRATRGERVRG